MEQEPKTLQEAIVYFSDPTNCREYVVARRWPNGVTARIADAATSSFWRNTTVGNAARNMKSRQFTLKTGTVMEDSPHRAGQMAHGYVAGCELQERDQQLRSSPSYRDHPEVRMVHGSQHPLRLSMAVRWIRLLVMSKPMKPSLVARPGICTPGNESARSPARAEKIKPPVMGILERGKDGKHSKVRTTVFRIGKKSALQAEVRKHVEVGSALYTDSLKSYDGLDRI